VTAVRVLAVVILVLTVACGIAIIAAAGYGELLAIYALYQQHDQATTRHVVLIATMFLIIFVVAGPMVAYLIGAFRREETAQAPAEPQQAADAGHPAAQEPIVAPEAEPDKPGPV
jgi:heme/copper-type cytochrome/quinol oxidase subunit 2